MLLVLQHKDGRWCAPSMSDGEISEEAAQTWADAVCETLGLPTGSLVAHIVEDDADPRKGDLISEPPTERAPEPQRAPSPLEQLVTALVSEPALSQATKDAISAIAGGEVAVGKAVPMVPQKG